jgi:proteasome-associated ATPase
MNRAQFVESLQSQVNNFMNEPSQDGKAALLSEIMRCQELSSHVALEAHLLDRCAGISQVKQELQKLKEVIHALSSPPCYQALLINIPGDGRSDRAVVVTWNGQSIETSISPELDRSSLHVGNLVVLNHDANCIIGCRGPFTSGEVGELSRILPDGRLVLSEHSGELVIVRPVEPLRTVPMKSGSKVRYDRQAALAFEVIQEQEYDGSFLDNMVEAGFQDIGGLDREIEQIREALFWPFLYPEKTRSYKLSLPKGILLSGPPGCGKTLLARATICEFFKILSGSKSIDDTESRRHFFYLKGPEIMSMWVGEAERKIRDVFRNADELSRSTGLPVFLFWDEFDAVAPIRGSRISSSVDSTIVPAFISELDGLDDREGKIVLMAATNRPDTIDPAVTRRGRMDYSLNIPRPDRNSAREILKRYLTADLPYRMENGNDRDAVVEELLEAAVSYIYRHGNNDGSLATILFRDGTRRSVHSHQLFSGAVARNIVRRSSRASLRKDREKITGSRDSAPC